MTPDPRWRNALLLVLSCSAGCVDAISYLQLGNVFAANMTGHTVLLGVALVGGAGTRLAYAASAIVGFVAGAMIGSWAVEAEPRHRHWPATVTRSLWAEAALLAVVAILWIAIPQRTPPALTAFILACALAMGLQSSAVRDLKVAGISTTYLTGTLTTLAAGLVAQMRGGRPPDTTVADAQTPALLACVWLVYIAGATIGAYASRTVPTFALVLPAAMTLAVSALAAWRYGAR